MHFHYVIKGYTFGKLGWPVVSPSPLTSCSSKVSRSLWMLAVATSLTVLSYLVTENFLRGGEGRGGEGRGGEGRGGEGRGGEGRGGEGRGGEGRGGINHSGT